MKLHCEKSCFCYLGNERSRERESMQEFSRNFVKWGEDAIERDGSEREDVNGHEGFSHNI